MKALSNCRARRGAGLANVIVIVAASALLFLVVAPLIAAAAKEVDNRTKCAVNLRNIAGHAFIYANADTRAGQKFPRLKYDRQRTDKPEFYTGVDSKESFTLEGDGVPKGGPKANDVTGAFYLILKTTDTRPDAFICPDTKGVALKGDIAAKSNFPGRENLSYSYNNPYPSNEAVSMGWKFDVTLGPDHPFAADMNPGDTKDGGPTKVTAKSTGKELAAANSPNHGGAGQNVAYCDGHVEWQTTPFCGVKRAKLDYRDNIYAMQTKDVGADGKGGTIVGPAQDAADAVMLPTVQDGPQPK